MKGFIYEYFNSAANTYYIGQTRLSLKKRDWGHRHNKRSKSHFDRAYQKNPEQFTFRILVEINTKTKELLIKTLNVLEVAYISIYRNKGKALYNILNGGNQGWKSVALTQSMLEALILGHEKHNHELQANKLSPEERAYRHNISTKKYALTHPEKYKEIITRANARRKEAKREWYLKNKDRLNQNRRAQKALSNAL